MNIPLKYKINFDSKETIEPEEIFFDPSNITVDSMGQVEVPIKKTNIFIFFIITAVLLAIFGGKVLYMQIFRYDYFFKIAESNKTRHINIEAPRGIIFDRSGRQLVFNESFFDLAVIPAFFPVSSMERMALIDKLTVIAGESNDKISGLIKKRGNYFLGEVIIKENIDYDSALSIESQINGIDGIYFAQKNYAAAGSAYLTAYRLSTRLELLKKLVDNYYQAGEKQLAVSEVLHLFTLQPQKAQWRRHNLRVCLRPMKIPAA